jgi:predicted Zn finger-like uncharacterized protein
MAITTLCPGCRALFRLPDDLAGKQVKCQKCGERFVIPGVPVEMAVRAEPEPPAAAPPLESAPGAATIAYTPPPGEPMSAAASSPPDVAPATPPDAMPAPVPAQEDIPMVILVDKATNGVAPPKLAGRDEADDFPLPRRRDANGRPTTRRPRPRQPMSTTTAVVLVLMVLVAVGAIAVGGVVWLFSAMDHRPRFVQNFPPPMPMPGGPVMVNNNNQMVPNAGANDNLARKLKIENGVVEVQDRILRTDPIDPTRGHNCKLFLVELEAGKLYVLEHRRQAQTFDPYLRVESQDGRRLAENDDGGIPGAHPLDSQVVFQPQNTATYRITATSLGGLHGNDGPFKLTIRDESAPQVLQPPPPAAVTLPKPQVTNQRFATIQNAEAGPFALATLGMPFGTLDGELAWAADGKSFYVLSSSGVLRRLDPETFVEQRRLDLHRPAQALAVSKAGLVVSVPTVNEVWVIHPEELTVTKRVHVPNAQAIAAAPAGSVICVASGIDQNGPPGVGAPGMCPGRFGPPGAGFMQFGGRPRSNAGIVLLDLAKDAPGKLYRMPMRFPTMTPDGRHLFTADNQAFYRYRVQDNDLVREEASANFPIAGTGLFVSPDGGHVALAVPNLGSAPPGHPAGPNHTFIYPVGDLKKPATTITAPNVRAVGFDPKDGQIFASTFGRHLLVFGRDGQKRADYAFPAFGLTDDPRQFLAHPSGDKLVIRYSSRLVVVMLKDDPANREPNRAKGPEPAPAVSAESLAGPPQKKKDAVYRQLGLPGFGGIGPVWDADGQNLYHVEARGTLHRLRGKDFVPEVRIDLGAPAVDLACSAEGPLVALRTNEVVLLDPKTLAVRHRFQTPVVRHLTADPRQPLAVAVGVDLLLLDLKKGVITARGVPGGPFPSGVRQLTLSPDGRYVLLAANTGVRRVRIEPEVFTAEENKSFAVNSVHAVAVTPDARQVAFYAPSALSKAKNAEATDVYPVADWKAPAYTIPLRLRAAAWNAGGGLYAQTADAQIFLLDRPADKDAPRRDLGWTEGRVRTLAPHPRRADTCLIATASKVYVTEVGKE